MTAPLGGAAGCVVDRHQGDFGPGNAEPIVPTPSTLMGRGYDFALDGGELTGVALLTLPLPVDALPPYDVAPYHWNGKTWERINGRTAIEGIQLAPFARALRPVGQWVWRTRSWPCAARDAAGQQTVPLVSHRPYRYSGYRRCRMARPSSPDFEAGYFGRGRPCNRR